MEWLVTSALSAILKVLADACLSWLTAQQDRADARDAGRQEEANAINEDAARRADEIGTIAAHPVDPDDMLRRLRDGTA